MTRGAAARGAGARGWAPPPPKAVPIRHRRPLDAAILFAPVGDLVLPALEALDRGGTLAIAGIHLSDIPAPQLPAPSVPGAPGSLGDIEHPPPTARAFLDFAAEHHIKVTTPEYPLSQADRALSDLSAGRIAGAAVLLV